MKVLRGGVHHQILTVLVAAMLAMPALATAADLCPYDTTGDYTYDANRTPTYLFFGDGQITYDGSIQWYMDDTLACFNVYQTPGYLQYFPKCDLDGNGTVNIDEVYDVYYRVHPANQTDPDVQKICSQMFRTGPFYFCHPSRYNRIGTDRDAIVANYPAAAAIFDGLSGSMGQQTLQWEYKQLRCSTPGAFNPAAFDALNECYLGTTTCEGQPCQAATIDFSQHVDPYLTEMEYSDVAQNYGGICERVATPHQVPQEVPGVYSLKYASDGNYWIYYVRATAQCVGDACACEHRYELYTHKNYPGNVYFMNETNLSTASCTDTRFPGACSDADADGVCDTDDQCPGEDDTLHSDSDTVPDCLDGCPLDANKTDPGVCNCGTPDDDANGNGTIDCLEACYPDQDSDNDTVCDADDWCPGFDDRIDTDGDGAPDGCDGCPNDGDKVAWGVCGCGENDLLDTDGDTVVDCLEECPLDPGKTAEGVCGCGVPDIDANLNGTIDCQEPCYPDQDSDNDGVCDAVDQCPGHDDQVDSDGDTVPDGCDGCPADSNKTDPGVCNCGTPDDDANGNGVIDCLETTTIIEDFENDPDTWPWAPWVKPRTAVFEYVSHEVAYQGTQSIVPDQWTYRTDVSYGTAEYEVLSLWCYLSQFYGCSLGFGTDESGTYYLNFRRSFDTLSFKDSHGQDDPWTEINPTLAVTYVESEVPPHAWYKLEVHVRAGGEIDGQMWAADGTPIASVQHNFGPLPATGVAFTGTSSGDQPDYVDTIELGMGDGSCMDIDQDGSCDRDDLCVGDDTTGDDDGDGVCNDNDICWGVDLLGDPDGNGVCEPDTCNPSTPPFYDQTGSDVDWAAGGTCVEMNGIGGPMACALADWQRHVNDINQILDLYPFTAAIFDGYRTAGQTFSKDPYLLLCSGMTGSHRNQPLFDDLDACYEGNSVWNTTFDGVMVHFGWGVNVWSLVHAYSARAALLGGQCELNSLFGAPAGFHAADNGAPWSYWTAHVMADCLFGGCRCDATVTGWGDGAGNFYEDAVVNNNRVMDGASCTDPRFAF